MKITIIDGGPTHRLDDLKVGEYFMLNHAAQGRYCYQHSDKKLRFSEVHMYLGNQTTTNQEGLAQVRHLDGSNIMDRVDFLPYNFPIHRVELVIAEFRRIP